MRRLLIVLSALAFCGSADAQVCPGVISPLVMFTSEAITVSSTSIGVTSTIFTNVNAQGKTVALVEYTLESNPIRTRADGVAPTATVGRLINNSAGGNVSWTVCGEAANKAFRMIRTSADAAVTAQIYTTQ